MTAHIVELRTPAPLPGATPTLEGLAWLLRHPRHWPEGFEWDYQYADQCAIGLASEYWSLGVDLTHSDGQSIQMARTFDLSAEDANNIFYRAHRHYRVLRRRYLLGLIPMERRWVDAKMHHVTPGMVADVIDGVVAERVAA